MLAAAAACGPERPPWTTAFDPLTALPLAEAHRETARLQPPLGNPAARAAGWVPAQGAGPRWSRGPAADLDFFVAAPRPLTLVVRGAAAAPGPEPRRVAVLVNGERAGDLAFTAELGEQRLDLTPELLRTGANALRFEHPWAARRGAGRGAGGATAVESEAAARQLAVAWHELRLAPGTTGGDPRRDGDALVLPLGTLVDWYFPASGVAILELPEVGGPEGARLRVTAQTAEGLEEELARVEPEGRKRWLELPGGGDRLVKLSFAAVPPAAGDPGGALRVVRPRVLGREREGGPEGGAPAAHAAPPSSAREPTPPRAAPAAAAERPPILVYLVDTLRADRLGAYGSRRGLTPELDRFARSATVFRQATAQAPWTRPSVATLFTGRGPLRHGVTRVEHRLPASAVTLAERLRDAGYATAAISANAHVTKATGMAQGFAHFEFLPRQPSAETVHELALGWLDGRRDAAPYFLYLHVLEPHAPYAPPPDLRERFAPDAPADAGSPEWMERFYRARGPARRALARPLASLYDGDVAAADRAFGALRLALEERGEWDRLLVVFVSDHGEGLGERGVVGHAQDLSQEALAVPLIVKRPRQRQGEVVEARAQHVDVLPTLLAAAGLPLPADSGGVDLLGAPPKDPHHPDRPAISHLDYRGRVGMSVVWGRWKWIEPMTSRFGDGPQLFDLSKDPGETRDVAAAQPVVAGWLRTLLRAERLAASGRSERAELDAETRDALDALGYL